MESHFSDIVQLIRQARNNAIKSVNTELINLYWEIVAHISQKVEASEWGKSVVKKISHLHSANRSAIKRIFR